MIPSRIQLKIGAHVEWVDEDTREKQSGHVIGYWVEQMPDELLDQQAYRVARFPDNKEVVLHNHDIVNFDEPQQDHEVMYDHDSDVDIIK